MLVGIIGEECTTERRMCGKSGSFHWITMIPLPHNSLGFSVTFITAFGPSVNVALVWSQSTRYRTRQDTFTFGTTWTLLATAGDCGI